MLNSPTKDDAVTNLKNAAHDAGTELHHAANQAGRKVRSMIHSASDEISHVSESVTSEIRANPVRSSLIALGAGVLLGVLLRR